MTSELPQKLNHAEIEARLINAWDQSGIYLWDKSRSRQETFVVDTPPPTVSGSLHVGHVFSYTHTDIIVRYKRMHGLNISYPMGWDDNGLATERRVQNYFNITCNPTLPYQADWKAIHPPKDGPPHEVSRRNFIEACHIVTKEDEAAFEALWRRLGLSLDWTQQYATIDDHCRQISQYSFLDLVKKDQVYNSEAPTMWDVDFRSAIAQAEVEDREVPGAYHTLRFGLEDGHDFLIATTRPELLPACIAVAAHPDDERYKKYFGKYAITPLFRARVPIVAAKHADPEKGTGILMLCTFGDAMDVEWWKQSNLPVRQIISEDGKLLPLDWGVAPFESLAPEIAQNSYQHLSGLSIKKAQQKIAELLAQDGCAPNGNGKAMLEPPKQISHPVKFYEKGTRPLEFITTRQWFIKTLAHRQSLLEQGAKVKWYPSFMEARYRSWVEGLNQDWCISRQRFFGVPFPVWYPIDKDGQSDYSKPIYADSKNLPIDPQSQCPPGYNESQREKPGGFRGDPDVMDTWATSALTPQIQSHWSIDSSRHKRLFPADIRPQAHEIIRTWAFSSIVKAWMHEDSIPWKNIVISGWILDPDRKKMSKSKGNVVTPAHLLEEYSSDAVRYWAGRARLGTDTIFDEGVMQIGRKLATKVFNASRFVFMQLDRACPAGQYPAAQEISTPLDLAMIDNMRVLVERTTSSFEQFDYAGALQATEDLFWNFCDHYLELVKKRSYAEEDSKERRSALACLSVSLRTFLKLFAPVMPYITEEVWSWRFAGEGRDASIHTSSWPELEEFSCVSVAPHQDLLETAVDVVGRIRAAKTSAQKSLKWPVSKLDIIGTEENLNALKFVLDDVLSAANAAAEVLTLNARVPSAGQTFEIKVALAEK